MRVVVQIEWPYQHPRQSIEFVPLLGCLRDPEYYNRYHTETEVSDFVHTFEGLDFRNPRDERKKAGCGFRSIFPKWERWLACSGNWCAWTPLPKRGGLVIADGRRHGIPWPAGFPTPIPGYEWDSMKQQSTQKVDRRIKMPKSYHEEKPHQHKFLLEDASLWFRRLGLSVSMQQMNYTLYGYENAPTMHWFYMETQREDLLPWQTADDVENGQ